MCEDFFSFFITWWPHNIFIIIKFKPENAIVTITNSFQNQEKSKEYIIISNFGVSKDF